MDLGKVRAPCCYPGTYSNIAFLWFWVSLHDLGRSGILGWVADSFAFGYFFVWISWIFPGIPNSLGRVGTGGSSCFGCFLEAWGLQKKMCLAHCFGMQMFGIQSSRYSHRLATKYFFCFYSHDLLLIPMLRLRKCLRTWAHTTHLLVGKILFWSFW